MKFVNGLIALSTTALALAQPGQHAGDIFVAQSALGQLKIGAHEQGSFDATYNLVEVAWAPSGALGAGWYESDPGFDAYRDPNAPDPDFQPMTDGANIYLKVVSLDPAARVFRFEPGLGFVILDGPGDRLPLGDHELHKHPFWAVVQAAPGYADKKIFEATFVLEDDTGLHTPSAPFTLKLTYAPVCGGDINADRITDDSDLGVLLNSFGSCAGDPQYLWAANVDGVGDDDGTGCVTDSDLGLLLNEFGCGLD